MTKGEIVIEPCGCESRHDDGKVIKYCERHNRGTPPPNYIEQVNVIQTVQLDIFPILGHSCPFHYGNFGSYRCGLLWWHRKDGKTGAHAVPCPGVQHYDGKTGERAQDYARSDCPLRRGPITVAARADDPRERWRRCTMAGRSRVRSALHRMDNRGFAAARLALLALKGKSARWRDVRFEDQRAVTNELQVYFREVQEGKQYDGAREAFFRARALLVSLAASTMDKGEQA